MMIRMKCGKVRVDMIMFVFSDDEDSLDAIVEALVAQIRVEATIQGLTLLREDEW